MKNFWYHENKGYTYPNRKITEDFVARTILDTTNSDEPFKLTYDSTKKQRKKMEKNSR